MSEHYKQVGPSLKDEKHPVGTEVMVEGHRAVVTGHGTGKLEGHTHVFHPNRWKTGGSYTVSQEKVKKAKTSKYTPAQVQQHLNNRGNNT